MKHHHIEYGLWTLAVLLVLGICAWGVSVIAGDGLTLSIDTTPDKASVWVDGHYLGTTPVTADDIPPGDHLLRVRRHGHAGLIRRIHVLPENATFTFALQKLPGGSLELRTTPPGAQVFVDGEPRGNTPLVVADLRPSTYALRLRLINYLDWTGEFTIEPGQTVKRSLALKSRTEAAYLAAIAENPKNLEARTDLAHYYILRDEWKKSEDAFTEALVTLARHPSETSHYANRLYQEVEKVFRSMFKYSDLTRGRKVIVNSFVRASRVVPDYETYYRVALHYAIDSNDTARLQDVAEAGLLNLPANRQWLIAGMHRYISVKRTGDGEITFLEQKVKKNPNDFVCRLKLSACLGQRGRHSEALKQVEAMAPLAKSAPVKAQLLADAARLRERLRDYAGAGNDYVRAAEAEPEAKDKAPFLRKAARAFGRAGRSKEELRAWGQAVAHQANVEVACEWRLEWAKLCIRMKQKPKAQTILREVLKLSKNQTTRSRAAELLKQT